MASKTQALDLPFNHAAEYLRDNVHGYTVYDDCGLDKSRIALDTHWTPGKQYGEGAQIAQNLDEFPSVYGQISYIDEENTYFLESKEGHQYGEMRRSTNGMYVVRAIKHHLPQV